MVSTNQTISPWALTILAIPLVVLTTSELMLGFWGDSGVDVPIELVAEQVHLELAARYTAMAAFVFFTAIAASVTAIFACDVYRRFTLGSCLKVVAALILVILVTLIFSVLEPEEINSFETYELLGENLFRDALAVAKTGACAPDRASCATGSAFDAMVHMLDLSNHVVSLAAACVLAGVILALGEPPRKATTLEERAHDLREARRVAKRYLYCTGVLLTAGMIWVQAWMSWPATLIADETARSEFLGLVNAFALFRGTTFSLLILSVYLPVYLLLAIRFETFWTAAPKDPELKDDKSLARITYVEALKTVTAIVAPILMGVIGSTWSISLGF